MFENFPYSNFHDLNTDWIVKKIKDVETSEANAKASEENAKASELEAKVLELNAQGFASQANNHAQYAHEQAQYAHEQAQASAQSAQDAEDTVENTNAQVAFLQSRVDNIIPSGTQTEGNTELLDIRVGYNDIIYNSAGDAVRNQVKDLNDFINQFIEIEQSQNLFDGDFTEGYFLQPNGDIIENQQYEYSTNYIPVTKGDVLTWWYATTTGNIINSATVRFVTAYNGGRQAIQASGVSSNTHSYTVPEGIKYIRFTYITSASSLTLMCINGTNAPVSYLPYYKYYVAKDELFTGWDIRKTMTINASDGINSFYSKMTEAYTNGNMDVYIGKGDYVYTNELIEQIRSENKRGIPIGNGCKYFFETGAYLKCEYTGNNVSDVVNFFSPLDTQNVGGSFEIHNLHLVSKNTVYALHDEANGSTTYCKHVYENCYLELDNSALSVEEGNAISKALGGGLGAFEEVIIRNCVFKATNPSHTTQYQNDASYHGANNSTFTDASIIVDGCYFENIFRTSNLGMNTEAPYPRVIYTNNSCSGRNADFPGNWNVKQWNNIVRN